MQSQTTLKETCLVFIWLYKSCDTIAFVIKVAMISVIDYSFFDPFFLGFLISISCPLDRLLR